MIEKNNNISFIIPVFNGASFIEDAYTNIINQKILNFEIIFIDNNSTDNSVSKILALRLKDDRVHFLTEKRQGAAAARNKGIKEAKGEFIHFFDVDDKLFDGAINVLKKVLAEYPKVMSVFGKSIRTNHKNIDLSIGKQDSNELRVYNNGELGILWLKHKSKLAGTPSFLHRRKVFKKIKGFQEDLLIGEDAFFHVQLGNEFCIASINRHIFHYYRHASSTIARENKRESEKIFTYWPQTIKAYLPYSKTTKVSEEFKLEVLKQIYGSMGKMILLTNGFRNRVKLKNKFIQEITPLKVPVFINMFLQLLVLTKSYWLYKLYVYYILDFYIKQFNKN
ncbi:MULTISPECIES: glycosyltransferase family 2 protein [Flavobacteriaceae]|uniref:Glycosyltransferase n=2 Tax=Flavobacteriaceae TaxID=49546 RepID=A0A4Y8AVL9_9FLAO|nr:MULTISPECIES: glycosyltransferase [Flavobacteriaceae]TEW76583.1 glycosyltransferase [Gramella jeungdoensis]GGK51774.1 glycosyl transferase [Lutibacter litoralis]